MRWKAIIALFYSVLIFNESILNWGPEGVIEANFKLNSRDSIRLHARCERFSGSKVRRGMCKSAIVAASERLTGRVVGNEDELPLSSLVLADPSCSVELCNSSEPQADIALS